MHSAAQKYLNTQMTITTQGELLVKLYDGAIRFLTQAKVEIEEKNYEAKGLLISKAMDVISELHSSLNKERGGEIAQNLHNLYLYANSRLMTANMRMDTSILDEVIKILSELRDAFSEIIQQGADTTAPVQGSVRPMARRAADQSQAEGAQEEDPAGQQNSAQPTPDALRKRIQAYGQAGM